MSRRSSARCVGLLVLDDLRVDLDQQALARLCGAGSQILTTTRTAEAGAYQLSALDRPTAHAMLTREVEESCPAHVLDLAWNTIGGHPLTLRLMNAAGVAGLGSPNPFTISDLSSVWILCDVYENDLANVHLGEKADIVLKAYPDKVFTGVISNIGPVLDPNIRTAKVRIEVRNPGLMRPGMFVTATFHGQKKETRAALPATAILHLHDRDWVYVPEKDNQFRRVAVTAGDMLPGGSQEIISGVAPGQHVVLNALQFQNTVEQ